MAKQGIGIGTSANDGTGDPLRTAMDKTNDNFNEVYALFGDGSTLAISGDATVSAGALTIAAGAVENSMLADDAVGADELAADAVVTASVVDSNITTAKIADDNVTFAKIENRYTALSALGSGTSFSLDFSAATTFTATASGNATFTFSNAVQGQVVDLILSGNHTITFSETGSTFNLVGTTEYDVSTNNLIQIVCTDDSAGSKIYHYSVAAYASDPTP
jgi:hypothetical protein